jgi:transcriptional regulator with XRE-family HTH domain
MITFHDRLKSLRDESDKKQFQIAEEIGITPQALSYIINGRDPTYKILCEIAKYFNVTTDYLLGMSPYKVPPAVEIKTEALDRLNKMLNYYMACGSSSLIDSLNMLLEQTFLNPKIVSGDLFNRILNDVATALQIWSDFIETADPVYYSQKPEMNHGKEAAINRLFATADLIRKTVIDNGNTVIDRFHLNDEDN